jgi:replicative superfamily II helicase
MISCVNHKKVMPNSFYVATVHKFDSVLSHKVSWFLVINDFIVDTFMFHF